MTQEKGATSIRKQDMARAAFFVGLSYLALLAYLFLVKMAGAYALPALVALTGAAIFLSAELSLAFLLTALFMQNSIIAALTEYGHAFAPAFNVMLGTSFAVTAMIAAACFVTWVRSRNLWAADNRDILRWTVLFSLAVAAYSVLGFVNADFKSVVIYDRVYLGGVMFLVIGVVAGSRLSLSFFVNLIRVLTVILIAWGAVEFVFQKEMLELFNVIKYMSMKYIDFRPAITSIDELLDKRTYLNLSGDFGLDIYMPRLRGPNMHPISYSYELCFCSLICLMFRSYILSAISFVMLFFIGAKGALVLAALSLSLLAFAKMSGRRPRILLLAMFALTFVYMAGVIIYGLITNDFHILGLIGSINGFLQIPLGRGVGVGGNLSTLGKESSDLTHFVRYQHLGAADVALESAFGVMLYQMGIAVSVFLVFYSRLWKKVWKMATAAGQNASMALLPIGLFFILINSVFQEEALSPAGWGLWLLAGGMFLGLNWRNNNSCNL
ncbi:MAG: hypothetical protein PHY92_04805 [Alphaproteobacteria bacterium]|nr:hypothetical protein [Alphaproteobacteria bacterium]